MGLFAGSHQCLGDGGWLKTATEGGWENAEPEREKERNRNEMQIKRDTIKECQLKKERGGKKRKREIQMVGKFSMRTFYLEGR